MPHAVTASSPEALARMKRQVRRDTRPELALRKHLHAAGLRYRVDFKPLPDMRRKADIVFTRAKVAVYVHGCFWHRCPLHATRPKSNAAWWEEKLSRNVERDADTRQQLEAAGWVVVEVWEHEAPKDAARRVQDVVADRRAARAARAEE